MRNVNLKGVAFGLILGAGLNAGAASLLAQPGTAQPVRSETQYFVTGEGDEAHLLFFTKGQPTRMIWYYDLTDVKVRKKTPLTLQHFEDFFDTVAMLQGYSHKVG